MEEHDQIQRSRFLSSMPYEEYKQHFPNMTPKIKPIQPKFDEDLQIPLLVLPPSSYQGNPQQNNVVFTRENKVQEVKNIRKSSENICDRQIFTYLQNNKNK